MVPHMEPWSSKTPSMFIAESSCCAALTYNLYGDSSWTLLSQRITVDSGCPNTAEELDANASPGPEDVK